MSKLTITLIAFGLCLSATGAAQVPTAAKTAGQPSLELTGVSVAWPYREGKFEHSKAFGLDVGTTLYFKAVKQGWTCFAVDPRASASKVLLFADDKGTVLVKPGAGNQGLEPWLSYDRLDSEKNNYGVFPILSPKPPAAGARHLRLRAQVGSWWGSQEKTTTQEVTIRGGERIDIGGIPVSLTEGFRGLGYKSTVPLERITDWTMLDTAGKEIEDDQLSSWSGWDEGGFRIDCPAPQGQKIKLQTTYYSQVEKMSLPLDVKPELPWVEPIKWMVGKVPIEVGGWSVDSFYGPSVEVHFFTSRKDAQFLWVDPFRSTLKSFVDDQGTVLAEAGPARLNDYSSWLEDLDLLLSGPNRCLFQIKSRKSPNKAAQTVRIQAEVMQVWGLEPKTVSRTVALTPGSSFQLGPLSVQIKEIKKEGSRQRIELGSDQTFDLIKELQIVDDKGTVLKKDRLLSYPTQDRKFEAVCRLPKELDKVTLEAVVFQKVEEVRVPIDVSLRLGFWTAPGGPQAKPLDD